MRGSCHARHCALLLMRDVIRLAAGPNWQPKLVLTTEPEDVMLLRDEFHEPEIRHAGVSGQSFPQSLLSLPLHHRRRGFADKRDSLAFGATTPSNDFVGSLRQVIATLMYEGQCQLEQVAPALGLHPRTLQRRLSALGYE